MSGLNRKTRIRNKNKELLTKMEIGILISLLIVLISLLPFIFSSLSISIIENRGKAVFDEIILYFSIVVGILALIVSFISKFNPLKFQIFDKRHYLYTIILFLLVILISVCLVVFLVLFKILGYI